MTGNEKGCFITYAGLADDVVPGNKILIDDGLIELEVKEVVQGRIVCRVVNGGELGEKKGVNVPNVKVKLPVIRFWKKTMQRILLLLQKLKMQRDWKIWTPL